MVVCRTQTNNNGVTQVAYTPVGEHRLQIGERSAPLLDQLCMVPPAFQ
jgi:hypothetical protein